ncbi:MAG: cob(I)yrinic acid a,c-diamide adenosyltransferase [Chloroflexi bacterium]|nr:cob(I)yrinic acid a,c-diamide adenosyltransferase [Chloroflexota bacterium]
MTDHTPDDDLLDDTATGLTEDDTATGGEEEGEDEEDSLELKELQALEAAGPQPGETREQFATRLHEAQVALHKKHKTRSRPSQQKGLVVVNTGNGKGKTTAALGVLFRAWGRGMRVCMLQFIKATTSNYGENKAAKRLGIEIIPMGDGFTWLSENIEKDKATARACWELCKQKIMSGDYDIVILDEMTYTLSYGWLDVNEVISVLKERPEGMHVIITGRNALPELVEYADLVTEMTEIKHPYSKGIKAQKGLEF